MQSSPPFAAALQINLAKSFFARLRGLLGTRVLPLERGLYIQRCASIHTCFMRYPIDVIFLDRHFRVCKVVPALKPWRAAACMGAASVLELAAGGAQLHGIHLHSDLSVALAAASTNSRERDSTDVRGVT